MLEKCSVHCSLENHIGRALVNLKVPVADFQLGEGSVLIEYVHVLYRQFKLMTFFGLRQVEIILNINLNTAW